jgi:succinate dehydrogenase / fumarate reductase flavoprotein subunit
MLQKIMPMMEIVFTDCFMIRSKVVTIAPRSQCASLGECSVEIIDQCVAQGVPFAREYGGLLENRSFGGVQVSRTFYARGQTGTAACLSVLINHLSRQIALGTVQMYNSHEMLDLVKVDGKARGIIARNLLTGELERHAAHAVVLATGGYGNVFYLVDQCHDV